MGWLKSLSAMWSRIVTIMHDRMIMLTRRGRRDQELVFSKEIFDALWPYLDHGSKRAVRLGCSQMCAMASALVMRLDLSGVQRLDESTMQTREQIARFLHRVAPRWSSISTLVLLASSSEAIHTVLAVMSEQHIEFPNLTSFGLHLVGLHCTRPSLPSRPRTECGLMLNLLDAQGIHGIVKHEEYMMLHLLVHLTKLTLN
jgi:hypothetical protein